MAKVEILEVATEHSGERKTEYIVSPDGLVKQTQLRVIGRAFQNLIYDEFFDDDEKALAVRNALDEYFKEHNEVIPWGIIFFFLFKY